MAIHSFLLNSLPSLSPPPPPPPPEGGDAGFVTTTSLSRDGVSITLSAMAQVGDFDTPHVNDAWLRPIPPATTVTISAYTPGWGPVDEDGRLGNGAMRNMVAARSNLSTSDRQGFGQYDMAAGTPEGSRYDPAFRAAVPITLSPGDCLVIAESTPDVTILSGSNGKNKQFLRFVILHCVADLPFADELAPPVIWHPALGAKPRLRYSDIDETALPSLDTGGFGTARPTATALLSDALTRRGVDHHMNAGSNFGGGNGRKTFSTLLGARYYGRDIQTDTDAMYAFICSDAPIAEKRPVLKFIAQRAIDSYGTLRSAVAQGFPYIPADGGHQSGRIMPMIIGGGLLGSAEIRDAMRTYFSPLQASAPAEYGQRCYLSPELVAQTQVEGWNGSGGGGNSPFETPMGEVPVVPEWCGRAAEGGGVTGGQINNLWAAPNFYRTTGSTEGAGGQTAAIILLGLQDALGHPALIDYHVRWHGLRFYGDDPWRYVNGNPAPRYGLMPGLPSSPSTLGFVNELFDRHVFRNPARYRFPAGVNPFNGAS